MSQQRNGVHAKFEKAASVKQVKQVGKQSASKAIAKKKPKKPILTEVYHTFSIAAHQKASAPNAYTKSEKIFEDIRTGEFEKKKSNAASGKRTGKRTTV